MFINIYILAIFTSTVVTPISKRICSGSDLSPPNGDDSARLCHTQPLPRLEKPTYEHAAAHVDVWDEDNKGFYCFSQPAVIDDLLLNSQVYPTQTTQISVQKLVRRMTRFSVSTNLEESISRLETVLESLGCTWKIGPPCVITASTTDRRNMPLVFKTTMFEMTGKVLLDFRLSRGDGIEFKRKFVEIKENLKDSVERGAPITWSFAAATNTVP